MSVLYTDYENYGIVYECYNLDGGRSTTNLWISSRRKLLEENFLNEAYEKIKPYFDVNSLIPVYHDEEYCAPLISKSVKNEL